MAKVITTKDKSINLYGLRAYKRALERLDHVKKDAKDIEITIKKTLEQDTLNDESRNKLLINIGAMEYGTRKYRDAFAYFNIEGETWTFIGVVESAMYRA